MNEQEVDTLKKQVQLFVERKIAVHIELNNDRFYNGIIGEINSDFFMLDDFKLGEMPIFYLQIKSIETFTTKSRCEDGEVKKDGDTDTRQIKAKRD